MEGPAAHVIPISRIKLVDVERLAARFGGAAPPSCASLEELRPSSRERVFRLLGDPQHGLDKPVARAGRGRGGTRRLRLFRAFKLLGELKREAPPAALRAVGERLARVREALRL